MIRDLDDTIQELLETNWPGSFPPSINFETPYAQEFTDESTINLFLYDIRENLELRSTDWFSTPVFPSPPTSPPTFTQVRKKRPRVQVDCSYIITAWTNPSSIKSEHHLLSTAIDILLKYRKYPESVLQGDLAVGGNTLVYRTLSLQTDYLSMGEYWQAMQGKPKVAFNYQVTLSTDISIENDVVDVIREGGITTYLKKRKVIKGFVLESATGDPYPNVNVLQQVTNPVTGSIEYQHRDTTDENGKYVGGGFIPGRHTIRYEDSSNSAIWTQLDITIPAEGDEPYIVEDVEL